MTLYFFKVVLCSAILLAFYLLLLQKEKMHRFNRFYLLFSITFSFVVPLISIETNIAILPVNEVLTVANSNFDNVVLPSATTTTVSYNSPNYLLIAYLMISACFLLRFFINTACLINKTRRNKTISYKKATLVLIQEKLLPHTYLHYIFLNRDDYEQHYIEPEILDHELAHVDQKHTCDILFIELALVFAWINPILFLYKKYIQLNHEYLADDKVLSQLPDYLNYQRLLLKKVNEGNSLSLTSQFNYLLTKKRLIMMTRKTSGTNKAFIQAMVLVLVAVSMSAIVSKSVGQETRKEVSLLRETGSTKEGVTEDLQKEYDDIINSYKINIEQKQWWNFFGRKISEQDRNRMETIFKQMSKTQQEKQTVFFMGPLTPMAKNTPQLSEYEEWKNDKVYGIWINSKRVPNSELDKYTNKSFAHVFVSKLSKNAINYGKHYYQVNLMTPDEYDRYYSNTISNKKKVMMFRVRPEIVSNLNDIFTLQIISEIGC